MKIPFWNEHKSKGFPVEAACCNHIGKKRKNNEDNFFFQGQILPMENEGLSGKAFYWKGNSKKGVSLAVFDGMGGEADGEIASYLAAPTFSQIQNNELLTKEMPKEKALKEDMPEAFLKKTVLEMNQAVFEESQKRFCSMGSTTVILYIKDEKVFVCNVGDSKAFLAGEELVQLSKDHTDEAFLREHGITDRKPVLSQYLGADPEELMLEPFFMEKEIERGDCFLLCSDGLTDMLSGEQILHILREEDSAKACAEHLVQEALDHGGYDNITVMVVKMK